MPRQLTPAAQAAKLIRRNLRAQGLVCTVYSSNYSMGCSVTVKLVDQPPEIAALVRQYCGRFQYGHFDGMTDYYDPDNRRTDIPQAKFVSVDNEMSDAARERVYQWLRQHWHGGDALPDTYEAGCNMPLDRTMLLDDAWVCDRVSRLFYTADSPFWRSQRQAKAA